MPGSATSPVASGIRKSFGITRAGWVPPDSRTTDWPFPPTVVAGPPTRVMNPDWINCDKTSLPVSDGPEASRRASSWAACRLREVGVADGEAPMIWARSVMELWLDRAIRSVTSSTPTTCPPAWFSPRAWRTPSISAGSTPCCVTMT